jgi:CheY-like chemotaxis protein
MAAVDLCASQLQGRARVVVDVPALPPLRIDEGQLCQVLTNVLLNAAHASDPARAAENRIIVRGESIARGAKVRLSVHDDGCGIDPANVGRVFDPFFTTKAPGEGTGVGLFVSKRIVEDAGGTLEVASTLGRGTRVRITLPAFTPNHSDPRRCSLLVVDDEPAFLRSLQLVLDAAHDVVVCSQSLEALEMVRAQPQRFDAVLCDLSMPHLDGVGFYKHMEALGIEGRFVLMTAGAFTPRAEEFLRQSKCLRLGKPFALEGLLAVIASVAERGRLHMTRVGDDPG